MSCAAKLAASLLQVRYSFDYDKCDNDGADCDAFIIDPVTGSITAARGDYNRQDQESFILEVVATDQAPSAIEDITGNNTGRHQPFEYVDVQSSITGYAFLHCSFS